MSMEQGRHADDAENHSERGAEGDTQGGGDGIHGEDPGKDVVQTHDIQGDPDKGLGEREQGVEGGDGPAAIQTISYQRSAPLPTVDEFAGYERVLPGAASRIVAMAERSIEIEAEDRKAAREMNAAAGRAENISVIVASVAFSFLPWVGFGAAIMCAFFGNNTGAFIGSIIGAISAGPQLIDSLRKKR